MILLTLIITSSFFYINEPVVTMRESPTNNSQVVSQAIYAEKVDVEKDSDGWSFITTSDQYTGWVPNRAIIQLKEPFEGSLKTSRLAAHIYDVDDVQNGPFLTMPYGAQLHAEDSSHHRWTRILLLDGRKAYVQKGDVEDEPKLTSKADLVEFSKRFLGLPYTWGGRSSFGYDCSGFVQMLYNKIGISLKRDSKLQINDSRLKEIDIAELELGDLIFFGKSKSEIRHVGMYVGNNQMIHSVGSVENKPWLRISNLSDFQWSGSEGANYPYRTARQLFSQ